jgi:hypothetical protein
MKELPIADVKPEGFTMLFLIGAPRSGTTMLERMLSAHSMIQGGAEPHLLTPLAHLGVWAQVDKAPYDHIVAALGQKDFVAGLPQGEQDYWAACRAYCDVLYGRSMRGSGRRVCLDKTPEYATVLPFIGKVFPDARYVVLTRHPLAVFSSFANSFFDGNYRIAQAHDPIMERYVPALAHFLRQTEIPFVHVRYEDLVATPETCMRQVFAHVGVPYEAETVDYAMRSGAVSGLGDPLGVGKHKRPSTESMYKWADDIVTDSAKLSFVKELVARLNPADLATLGYPLEDFWAPLERRAAAGTAKVGKQRLNRYLLSRKLIVHGRALVQRSARLRAVLRRARLACDVLLREY